ncbi:ATP-binding cassette sub-family G member 4 isoform X1 [Neodiprion pinetum]|uniref:ATP-binding cassette sub-family G member 4 isoform X1 n=1 Tax=Neodiprion pinetum TaxID=441929 RepID=UPI001EDF0728|nr:ATP-binding cassette sub-family G member 4-like isoform X1 [Neodiprion pinetum]
MNSIQLTEGGTCTILRLDEDSKLLDIEAGNPATSRLVIEFANLSYAVDCDTGTQKQKQILCSVAGHFRPGRLTAIIGPSGAGKTTLLSIISGLRASKLMGTITINGVERNREAFRRQVCYIPQDFALLPLLTVRETLQIAADLKLGSPHTDHLRRRAVIDIASKLGLLSSLDTAAGNLSGGERKRLSIGIELITNPPVMLLDEPTSGLDSAASGQVIALLHSLAEAGRTVVCTVHQPGSHMISLFDDIVVLSRGQIMYCGPRDQILDSFAKAGHVCPQLCNLAEFVLDVVSTPKENLKRLRDVSNEKYEAARLQLESTRGPQLKHQTSNGSRPPPGYFNKEKDEISRIRTYPVSHCKQFLILFKRAMICIQRDNMLTKLRIVAHLMVGLLVGIVFYDFGSNAARFQSNNACIFTSLLFLFFGNAMPAVQMFPIEAAVFLREHMNNWYSLQSYYMAKVLADIQVQVLCPTCFLIFAYWLTGQPLELDRIWRVWLICVLLTMLAQSFGIAAGAACGSQVGVFVVPALNIPMFLFAGFFLRLGEVSAYLRPICSISYFRYAFEGVLQALYGNSRKNLPCSEVFCPIRLPAKILSNLGMPTAPFYVLALALTIWIFALHISVYGLLRWKLYRATK